ncbi:MULTISPECIES: hypothetical protein [unclassified Bradyrhizobium]|uniref:hypothetical protein n=1 Tax=unclassified Bradyrhizobium TaxID=2631580 RepID=UPI0033930AEF
MVRHGEGIVVGAAAVQIGMVIWIPFIAGPFHRSKSSIEAHSEGWRQIKKRMIWNIGMREIFVSNYIFLLLFPIPKPLE